MNITIAVADDLRLYRFATDAVEVAYSPSIFRVTDLYIESVGSLHPPARVSDLNVEFLRKEVYPNRISDLNVEFLRREVYPNRVSDLYVEVLLDFPGKWTVQES
jgi:hypothetical protein